VKPRENTVQVPPTGLVLAIQYWSGDEAEAMRLARLLADIEPRRRSDVTLAFCRRFDMPQTDLAWKTQIACGLKFSTTQVQSKREGLGHPNGCNQLVAGILDELSDRRAKGLLDRHSVLFLEADGCPLRKDWLDIVIREHEKSLEAGRLITGAATEHGIRHLNGTMALHLSAWTDRPSLQHTPPSQAWDLFHSATLWAAGRPTTWMRNTYGAQKYSREVLRSLSKEVAWLASTKDDSALRWAEKNLVARRPGVALPGQQCSFPGCGRQRQRRGLCSGHLMQSKRGEELTPLRALRDRKPRALIPYPSVPGTLLVPLTQGHFAVIDEAEGPEVGRTNWQARLDPKVRTIYAVGRPRGSGHGPPIRLHRFLWTKWGMPEAEEIDHENRNGLDCRRANLRAATSTQNKFNVDRRRDNKSGIRGVCATENGTWRATFKHRHLGTFATKEAAAAAYRAAALPVAGRFAAPSMKG
jgi:hypothetical protein